MPGDYDLYVYSHELPRFLRRGVAETVQAPLRDPNGQQWIPDSATYTLRLGYGNDVIAPAAMTITGGIPTYTVPANTFSVDAAREDIYQEIVTATQGGETRIFTRRVAAVRALLYPVLDDNTLVQGHALLQQMGQAQNGFGGARAMAWGMLMRRFLQQDRWPDLILDSWALIDAHRHLARSIIFEGSETHLADARYLELADREKALYEEAWGRLRFGYDSDLDGVPSEAESGTGAVSTVWLGGSAGAGQGRRGARW